MKKILALLLIAGVGFVVARKTHCASYFNTCVAQVGDEVKRSIPTKFELQRIRHEISRLDADVARMIRPVAEWKTEIDWLRKDIQKAQVRLDEQRKQLLTMTEDLNTKQAYITYGDRDYPVSVVKQRLQKDFTSFKRQEAHAKTQQKMLEAKEASLKASQEQLAKVIEKKREYELRVAQLEAENETLQVSRIGNKLQIDNSRATQIENALRELEKQLDVDRTELELEQSGPMTVENIPVHQRPLDVNAIRDYLRQESPTETARSSK